MVIASDEEERRMTFSFLAFQSTVLVDGWDKLTDLSVP